MGQRRGYETVFYQEDRQRQGWLLAEYGGGEDITKAEAILDAIRKTDVGSDIILHNNDNSIWCILTVRCKEHEESEEDIEGGVL